MAETIFDKPLADPPFYNGLDKTVGGFALDARQGKVLSDQLTALNSKITDHVITRHFTVQTGSVSPNTTAQLEIQFTPPSGYKFLTVIPGYTGDDQFCWVTCSKLSNVNAISVSVRNCSSAADSGTASVTVLYIKE